MFVQAFATHVLDVQAIPSGDVITAFVTPSLFTAQNKLISGAQQTEFQDASVGLVRIVQLIPSSDVITRLVPCPAPLVTAQNRPSSGAQQTAFHPADPAGTGLEAQVIPSVEVATVDPPTAQNILKSGDQHTPFNGFVKERSVQFVPLGDVITLLTVAGPV